jgi:hypothetical protein
VGKEYKYYNKVKNKNMRKKRKQAQFLGIKNLSHQDKGATLPSSGESFSSQTLRFTGLNAAARRIFRGSLK